MATQDRPIVTIEARVLDSMNRYLDVNELDGREVMTGLNRRQRVNDPEHPDAFMEFVVAPADDGETSHPSGIVLSYDHPDCPLLIPPGRQLSLTHIGLFIDKVAMTFPLEPMTWDEMQGEYRRVVAQLDQAGWVRSSGRHTPSQGVKEDITYDDFLDKTGPKWAGVGFWEQCDNPAIKAEFQIKHYNGTSPGSFMPPAALSEPLDPGAEDTFLFHISIAADYRSPVERELTRLRDARRAEVNGRTDAEIPLSVWLDDPDWRPEDWDGIYVP
ncbi:hypothetical protein [Jannaschia sp. LMIT008]|uniref:hypothetical protein n=1 Tax=Jannaschia maritima TaxID=3032585 RepID=UPI002811A01D|nr:hypothetical protein [Jannaschia sp. LMIT008]